MRYYLIAELQRLRLEKKEKLNLKKHDTDNL
jgi:hypothetical protein